MDEASAGRLLYGFSSQCNEESSEKVLNLVIDTRQKSGSTEEVTFLESRDESRVIDKK